MVKRFTSWMLPPRFVRYAEFSIAVNSIPRSSILRGITVGVAWCWINFVSQEPGSINITEYFVHLAGGDMELEWVENVPVFMTGPATEVFSGEILL